MNVCSVSGCDGPRLARGWCPAHYLRWHRYGNVHTLFHASPTMLLADRMDRHIDRSGGPNSCWIWTGARDHCGYGLMRWKGRSRRATHLVYELEHGHPPPPDKPSVLHTCDNPPCVNGKHLWAGTQLENVLDMECKKRGNHPRGEHHGRAKLTSRQVLSIRKRSLKTARRHLAKEYGVSCSTINAIVNYETWKSMV